MMYPRQLGTALAVALVFSLAPGAASANIGKCEGRIYATAQKLNIATGKALSKCSLLTRAKGINPKTADSCEKNLAKVFNMGGPTGKGVVAKTIATIDKLFVPGKSTCTAAHLEQLGHMESGFNAPGVNPQDFLVSALVLRSVDLASNEIFAHVADFQETLTGLIDVTNCGSERPNLCSFVAHNNPDCRVHSCVLGATSDVNFFQGGGGTVPTALQNRILALKFCQAPPLLDLPVDLSSGYRAVFGDASRTLAPPPMPLGTNSTLCIDQIRAHGWCDCLGSGDPLTPATCLDVRLHNNGGTCSTSGGFCLTNADCPGRETCNASGFDGCGQSVAGAGLPKYCTQPNGAACKDGGSTRCFDAKTLGRCHSGTPLGIPLRTWSGASTAGDCAVLSTITYRVLPPAICRNGSNQNLGFCTTICNGGPCAADAQCTGLGGTQCIDPKGPDQLACTADDLVASSPPVTVPLTTATSSVTMRDFMSTQGTCSVAAVNAGMGCATSADCNGGFCSAALLVSPPNPNASRVTGVGAKLSCGAYDSGSLSGFRLVGSLPLVNVPVIHDSIVEFELACN